VVEVAGLKVGLVGLTWSTFGAAPEGGSAPPAPSWRVTDPVAAAREAVAAVRKEGAVLVVVVAHLTETQEKEVALAVPEIHAILGGGSVRMLARAEVHGEVVVAEAFSKGKYLSDLTFHVWRGGKPPYRFVDRYKKRGLEDELRETDGRIASYEKILETQKQAPPAEPPTPAPPGRAPQAPQAKSRVEFYQNEIVKLRADRQLLAMELEGVKEADPRAHYWSYELRPLAREIVHAPEVEASVVGFRKKYPKAPGH
jgi:hypothetical protein